MKDITPLNELDTATRRVPHLVQHAAHARYIPLIKCMNSETPKPRKAFYISHTGRASPYCIECNADAALKAKYKRELKREGVTGFQKRINRKEYQLGLMLKAVVEFQKK